MKKHTLKMILAMSISLISIKSFAQETDLLKLVEDTIPKKQVVKNAFKSTRVINGHSIEFLAPATMDFRILHRFGLMNQGAKNLFGLDQASMRLGFDFGILKNLQVGIGRSTYRKELDGYIKFAPIIQSTGPNAFPATIALVTGITLTTMDYQDPTVNYKFSSRIAYYFQTIIGRKFNEKLSLQLTPTIVHNNLVPLAAQPNDVYSMGFGGRLKMSKRTAFTWDYFYLFNGKIDGINYNPLSIGVDIETGGHVFQLHLSNAVGMNERAFITETTSSWENFDIRMGFNLSRIFQLKKKK